MGTCPYIRLCENNLTFKRHLKTHFFQTHLVFLCCIERLCIFRIIGAIQIRYYYYYYYYYYLPDSLQSAQSS